MKKIFSSALVISASVFATSASAQLFSGAYVGFDIGHDNFQVKNVDSGYDVYEGSNYTEEYTYVDNNGKDGGNGISGSLYAGYDVRIGSKFFVGVEARASLSDAKHQSAYAYSDYEYDATDNWEYEYEGLYKSKVKESFALSARAGYLLNDKTGIYVRGGLTHANMSYSDMDSYKYFENGQLDYEDINLRSGSDKAIGYTVGGGLETALSGKFSLRAEYNMARYNNAWKELNNQYMQDALDNGDLESFYRTDAALYTARVGISYRF